MKKINKIRVFMSTAALSFTMLSVMFPSIDNPTVKVTIDNSTVDDEYEKQNEKVIETTTETTTVTTTKVVTTTTIPTTTVVTTTEPVDEYKNIRNLEILNNNDLSIEEIDSFITKYSGYTKLDYDYALEVINSNLDSIENEYLSIRGGIMCTLFNHSNEIGLLSPYTYDVEVREDMTQEEKENIMIEFCDNMMMSNEEKYIVLSAFREETGRGTSSRCVYDNNYGGIRIYGEAGCNGEYGKYSTPEFGIYREVKLIYNKLKAIENDGYYGLDNVVYQFACRYNPQYTYEYSNKIMGWVYDVQSDYEEQFNEKNNQKTLH